MQSQSCRFAARAEAELRLNQVVELNGAHCVGEIVPCALPPEIFRHCGTVSTAVGCKCPGCGKELTWSDARVHYNGEDSN